MSYYILSGNKSQTIIAKSESLSIITERAKEVGAEYYGLHVGRKEDGVLLDGSTLFIFFKDGSVAFAQFSTLAIPKFYVTKLGIRNIGCTKPHILRIMARDAFGGLLPGEG